ncbi:MAG: 1-acyl-sn-glycerol-3-phosphate acyltransferase, partial [Deltaproteobacteria bacterium]|nr:1-acyl-sn-glycerol-3-phosphate acyltransferase [Deltaproteobacteria bacterium]
KILPKKSMEFHPGPIEVIVSSPIDARDYTTESIDNLIEKTRGIIVSNFNPQYPEERPR